MTTITARPGAAGTSPNVRAIGGAVLVVRVLLAGLFLFAAAMKLRDPQQFAFSVAAFKLLPDPLVALTTYIVPWTELVAGVCLLLGLWARAAAFVIALLLTAFIAGIASVLQRGMNVTCGCFGKFEIPCTGPLGACHLVRNGVLLAMAAFVVWLGPGSLAVDRESQR